MCLLLKYRGQEGFVTHWKWWLTGCAKALYAIGTWFSHLAVRGLKTCHFPIRVCFRTSEEEEEKKKVVFKRPQVGWIVEAWPWTLFLEFCVSFCRYTCNLCFDSTVFHGSIFFILRAVVLLNFLNILLSAKQIKIMWQWNNSTLLF
jgi:hypothetical protein